MDLNELGRGLGIAALAVVGLGALAIVVALRESPLAASAHACVDQAGALRLVARSDSCAPNERQMTALVGASGAAGARGEPGPIGPAGQSGPSGPQGPAGADGA